MATAALTVSVATTAAAGAPAADAADAADAAGLPLPTPPAPLLLPGIGATADRQRVSILPPGASATDSEVVTAALSPAGDPVAVSVDQRIQLHGHGDYVVIERGPAREAQVLGDGDPPTLKAGAVLYAGFLPPTGRLLSARLTLDPAYEAARLPIAVTITFTPRDRTTAVTLGPGGRVPGPGTVAIRLLNATTTVATTYAGDAPATAAAAPLDLLRQAAAAPGPRPPVAGDGLPTMLAGAENVQAQSAEVTAPLRVTGAISLPGGHVAGGGVSGGGAVDGVLAGAATFTATATTAGQLRVDLRAEPALDPRTLDPPAPYSSWQAWARSRPNASARTAAVAQLEAAAAAAAQIRVISPYLTTGLAGSTTTVFDYSLAPAAAAVAVARATPVDGAAVAVMAVAGALVLLNLELLRRRL